MKFRNPFVKKAIGGNSNRDNQFIFNQLGFMSGKLRSLVNNSDLLKAYEENCVVQSAIDILARAESNQIIKLRDLNTGEFIDIANEKRQDIIKFYDILKQPNPLQSQYSFTEQGAINYNVIGNDYTYLNIPAGFDVSYENLVSMSTLPAELMSVELTGKMFNQADINEIISKYILTVNGRDIDFSPSNVYHRKTSNIRFDANSGVGLSRLVSLQYPISNIDIAFESRNKIGKNRGMNGIISVEDRDSGGVIPLQEPEKEKIYKEMDKYGTLEGQRQFWIMNRPVKFHRMTLSPEELGLFKEVESDSIHIGRTLGVPNDLIKVDLTGSTFENQKESVIRLYQDTVIPTANDKMAGLSRMLNTKDGGFEIVATFDHVPALMSNQKDMALANKAKSSYMETLYMNNQITGNQWLNAVGLPNDANNGDRTLFELDESDRNLILGKNDTIS